MKAKEPPIYPATCYQTNLEKDPAKLQTTKRNQFSTHDSSESTTRKEVNNYMRKHKDDSSKSSPYF